MSQPPIVSSAIDSVVLQPAPITPAWIVAGAPVARATELSRSTDGTAVSLVWDCTAGTFNWHFGVDETVHILEGEVEVSTEGLAPRMLKAGDVALFRSGTTARWHVPRYVRKLAFCRHALPQPLGFALRGFNKLKSLVRGAPPGMPLAGNAG
ncbi:cupin domain-containing protein [Phreatobacter stygius]|uniref:DUF861 domain-containing protein n=1 Tax=Phreatobacter stygius TaxID=1940610 RepID=A0A4D7B0S3_9HYPH|nr:cupin domain-containing protein [Phreatobacter stygius]QCI67269.1 DUF861 domain-containing protein [Phreatobacter stygius]